MACQYAEKAKFEAEQSFKEYEESKGTYAEAKKADELKQKTAILQMWGKTCSEINSNLRWWTIFLTTLGGLGFIMAIIGFFIRRVRMFA